jgi:DNA-binding response OmpR family regulator
MEISRLLIFKESFGISDWYKKDLIKEGYEVDIAYTVNDADRLLKNNTYNLMIIDTKLKGKKTYKSLQNLIDKNKNNSPVIINTGNVTDEIYRNLNSFKMYLKQSADNIFLKGKMVFFISI